MNVQNRYDDFMAAEGEIGKGEWEEYYDDDSSAVYWYNTVSGESTYANPFETKSGEYGVTDGYGSDVQNEGYDTAEAQTEWAEYYDEESGAPYWYNTTSGETVWTDPNGGDGSGEYGSADAYGSDYNQTEGYGDDYGGGEYQEYFDDASGAPYWYNETTGETVWESPY